MKINFTKQEFRTLLELVDMTSWITGAIATDESDESLEKVAPYHALVQKLYAHAKDFGLASLIDYDNVLDEYNPSEEFEINSPHKVLLAEFEDIFFWDSVSNKLAIRDVVETLGDEQFDTMDLHEKMAMIVERKESWLDEFSEHGIERLDIKNQ